jgi:guanylate kinase
MDLQKTVENYSVPQRAKDIVNTTTVLLLVGISGAGKDTIKKQLLKESIYIDIVSHTTRQPRLNDGIAEIDTVDYHFIDDAEATNMLGRHDFIEAKYVHGTIYGTSIEAVEKAHARNKIAVTDLDVQGVREYKDISQEVMALFILPPDYETWLERLHNRYSSEEEFEQEWPKRRQSAMNELTHALEVPYYHFIINDDIDRAVRVINEIATRGDSFNRHDDEARIVARDLLEAIINAE